MPAGVVRATLVALVALIGGVVFGAKAGDVLRTTAGVVETAGSDDERHVWFELDRIDQRFVFDAEKLSSADDIIAALKGSRETGRAISVHYFVDGASFPFDSAKPIFIVHEATYDGKTIPLDDAPPPPDPNAVPLPRDIAAAALAKGIALAGDSDPREAVHLVSSAIASPALELPLQALAYKVRRGIYIGTALSAWPPGVERDKLFMVALADSRAWQQLAPDDPHTAPAVAESLAYLGAYDEAIAAYRQAIARWPDQDFWPEIRIAAIYRSLGDYGRSLATLDEIVKHDGAQTGMAWHYHRGWTLRMAGRLDEAIAEFDAGLKSQPDYGGAFFQRACALAQTGRLKDAIADQKQYIGTFAVYGNDAPPSPQLKHDRERAIEAEKELEAAYAGDPSAKTDAACVGYWDWGEDKRERSALLPAVATPSPATPITPTKTQATQASVH